MKREGASEAPRLPEAAGPSISVAPAAGSGDGVRMAGPAPLSFRDLRRLVLFTLGLLALWELAAPLSTLLLLFLLVFVLASACNPLIVRMERRGIRRGYAAMILLAGLVLLVALLAWRVVPPLLEEAGHLVTSLAQAESRLVAGYGALKDRHPEWAQYLPDPTELSGQVGPGVMSALGAVGRYTLRSAVGVLSVILLLALLVYTLIDPLPLLAGILTAVPGSHRPRVERILSRIMEQFQRWASGSLVLGVIIGVLCGCGLWVLGRITGHPIPYLLLFAVIAGVGEVVPTIGPILSAIPPIVVALGNHPLSALWIALLYFGIQQVENQVIVPLVMGKTLDLHPVSVMFSVLVMGSLFGLLGAILALPVCAIVRVCWEELYLEPSGTDREAAREAARRLLQ